MQQQTETALEENLKKTFHSSWHFVGGILSGHPSNQQAARNTVPYTVYAAAGRRLLQDLLTVWPWVDHLEGVGSSINGIYYNICG